jgi:propanol-preferring alcohol dehydrogenase
VADDKLALARELGAELTANAKTEDAVAKIKKETAGAHGVLVTAVSTGAFRQAIGMLRRGGTCSLVGLPPGEFPTPIFDVVLNGLTIRGSIVGTRNDIAEALAFAADGKVKAHYEVEPLEQINSIFDRMRRGAIQGRVVLSVR